ncbi:MAG: hypothetical protein WBB69_08910 [Anaerolineales bacterium]
MIFSQALYLGLNDLGKNMTVWKRTFVRSCFILTLLLSACKSRSTPTKDLQPMETETQAVVTPRSTDVGDSNIQIVLHSPNRFEVRNAAVVLCIGDAEFLSAGFLAGDTHTLTFRLSQQEFADLSDGEAISFLYGPYENEPRRFFGRLQKEMLQDSALKLTTHFDMTKQDAVDRLRDLQSSMSTDDLKESLDAALMALERSLESDLWDGPSRLDPAKGESVFIYELEALEQIERLENVENFPLESIALLYGLVEQIMLADRGLAVLAIEERCAGGLDLLDIQSARLELDIGDMQRLNWEYLSAVDHYRAAWLWAGYLPP